MTSPQSYFRKAVRSLLRSAGYDILPHPMSEWHEQQLTLGRHLQQVFTRYAINCVVDVGAHYGEYGAFLRALGYKGRIVSFEPVQQNCVRLRDRAQNDSQWTIQQMALGAEDATMDITVCHDTELSSFLTPNRYCAEHMGRANLVAGSEPVSVKKLASVFSACVSGIAEPRVFLKLDTQGYDLAVLEGANGCLNRIFGLQSELSIKPIYDGMPSYLEALPKMREMGFEVSGMFPVSRDWKFRLIEVDCVMVHEPGDEPATDGGLRAAEGATCQPSGGAASLGKGE